MSAQKINFLGLCYDNVSLDESIQIMEGFIRQSRPHQVFTPNSALIVWSHKDSYLRDVYQRTDLLTPDGMGVYIGTRILGRPVKANLPAVSMFFALLPIANEKGYRIYFLGARQGIVDKCVENLKRQYPQLQVAGFHHGHYSPEEEPSVIKNIRDSKPDILFVAMSTPQKERFIDGHKEELGVPVMIGVGGSFDIAAGVTRLAPRWIRYSGLEWLYRLVQEPRRLWRRYLETHPAFIKLLVRAFVRERLGFGRAGG